MKKALLLLLIFPGFLLQAQNMVQAIPDSVTNVPFPGSTGAYNVTNPLNHNGTSFTNPPIAANCFSNCKSDYLYFHDLDLQIPLGAQILGIEVIHSRGGCNQGSFVIDTLELAYNGAPIGDAKRDSASNSTTDTLGGSGDTWGNALTPVMLNSSSFGVMVRSTGTGICTFGQFDLRIQVYYCQAGVPVTEIPDSVTNVPFAGSNGAYSVTNPLNHNGTSFTNAPISVNCAINCKSDWLYFHDFGFQIPPTANISGFEVVHSRGGCNQGSYVIDTLSIAYGGMPVGDAKRDSASTSTTTVLGSQADNWGNPFLSSGMVNDPSFGVMIRSTGTGICTFGQFDVRLNVYYCGEALVGMQSATLRPTLEVYPNPAGDWLVIQANVDVVGVQVFDMMGREMMVKAEGSRLDIGGLARGGYFIVVKTADGGRMAKTVVKR